MPAPIHSKYDQAIDYGSDGTAGFDLDFRKIDAQGGAGKLFNSTRFVVPGSRIADTPAARVGSFGGDFGKGPDKA
jgi:hypothetical protein